MSLDFARCLACKDDGNYSNLCGQSGIAETAEDDSRRAALFIGIDSGPAHLANAVKTPGVILLGRYLTWDYYMPYTGFYADVGGIAAYFDTQVR